MLGLQNEKHCVCSQRNVAISEGKTDSRHGKQEGAVLGTGTVGPALNQTPDTDNFNSTEPLGSESGFEVRQVVLRLGPKKQG